MPGISDEFEFLQPDEAVLWRGYPESHFSADSIAAMVFIFLAGGFTLFFAWSLYAKGSLYGFIMAGVLALMVLAWVVKFFFLEPRRDRTACYFITDRRVVITKQGLAKETASFDYDHFSPVRIEKPRWGRGSLSFAVPYAKFANSPLPFSLYTETLSSLENVDEVYRVLEGAIDKFSKGHRE